MGAVKRRLKLRVGLRASGRRGCGVPAARVELEDVEKGAMKEGISD